MAKRLVNNQVLLAKNSATPAATDVVTVTEPVSLSFTFKSGDYKELDGTMGSTKTWVADDYLSVSGSAVAFLKGNGGGVTKPALDELLVMSGLDGVEIDRDADLTNDAIEYKPNSKELATGEILFYIDGSKRAVHNVSSNLKIDFDVGSPAKATFDIKGFGEPPIEETNPSVTLDNNDLFIVSSIQAVTLSGATLELTKCSFDMGNDIKEIYAINSKEFYRSDFKAKVSVTHKVGADTSYITEFLSGAIKSISVSLVSSNGNGFIFNAPTLNYTNVSESGSDELEATREFMAGNDFSITYY